MGLSLALATGLVNSACAAEFNLFLTCSGTVNVHGQTIHSFFGFKPGITLDKVTWRRVGARSIYRQLDMIIIDEVSMVRADLHRGLHYGLTVS